MDKDGIIAAAKAGAQAAAKAAGGVDVDLIAAIIAAKLGVPWGDVRLPNGLRPVLHPGQRDGSVLAIVDTAGNAVWMSAGLIDLASEAAAWAAEVGKGKDDKTKGS